jgi:hypothetical protein
MADGFCSICYCGCGDHLPGCRGAVMSDDARTFDDFAKQVRALLEPAASGKGYSATGADGPNQLYDFVAGMNGGPGHALGEIVYKAKRYAAKGNVEDVLKIAAWAFLVYRHHKG